MENKTNSGGAISRFFLSIFKNQISTFVSEDKLLQSQIIQESLSNPATAHKTTLQVLDTEDGRKRAIDYAFKSQRSNSDKFAGWNFAFIDSKGQKYYIPNTDMDLPINRLAVFNRYMDFLSVSQSPAEFGKLMDRIRSTAQNIMKTGRLNDVAKIIIYAEEGKEFLVHPVHAEMYFLIACTFYVREDEDPAVYDLKIEEEKYAQLIEDSKDGLYNFFYRTPLREHLERHGITESNCNKFVSQSWESLKMREKVMGTVEAS